MNVISIESLGVNMDEMYAAIILVDKQKNIYTHRNFQDMDN